MTSRISRIFPALCLLALLSACAEYQLGLTNAPANPCW